MTQVRILVGLFIMFIYHLFFSILMAKAKPKKKEKKKPEGKQIGVVSNYFKHVKAAAIKLSAPLKVGDKIKVKGGEKEIVIIRVDLDLVISVSERAVYFILCIPAHGR